MEAVLDLAEALIPNHLREDRDVPGNPIDAIPIGPSLYHARDLPCVLGHTLARALRRDEAAIWKVHGNAAGGAPATAVMAVAVIEVGAQAGIGTDVENLVKSRVRASAVPFAR